MFANYDDKFNSKKVSRARSKWHRAACKVDYLARMLRAHRRDKNLYYKLKSDLNNAKAVETEAHAGYVSAKDRAGIA